ncbi:alpha/beta fold hydrolase [Pseudoalteromonas mariniglutinosa]|uniref:alpha/beta fold hydrolase n=1 Tax=Pseudoalteromonas mariniglutinosa TaxID=206042 RepID=UPI00384EA47A
MFYSDEYLLADNLTKIESFFKNQMHKDYLSTPKGLLYYGYTVPPNAQSAIVISTGRIESMAKYQELLWELYHNHYAVFIIDHQGQGRSYRHLANKHKGHVNNFSDYAADFAYFNQYVIDKHWQGKKILLGHSMGSAIGYDYLARFEHNYKGAFLSAPMFDIYTKGTPKPIAKLVARLAALFGLQYTYALGQRNYLADDFAVNCLTSSAIRYQHFRRLYEAEPQLQLGGVTYGWLNAVFKFIASLVNLKVTTPLFIASAELDSVVDNVAQYAFTHRQDKAQLKTFVGAKHELFFERDEIRKTVLTDFYQFCERL